MDRLTVELTRLVRTQGFFKTYRTDF